LEEEDRSTRESELKTHFQQSHLDKIGVESKSNSVGKDFHFDSNVITPGTDFMHRLAKALRGYILERSNNDYYWKGLTIIFSDAFVPGEGEHKILDFIRTPAPRKTTTP